MSDKFIIELKGVGTYNKGAHLMLLSILKKFNIKNDEIIFCMEPNSHMNYSELDKYNIKPKIQFKDKKLPWDFIFNLIDRDNFKKYGLIHNKDIDLIIDASGFAYGDYWGARYIKKRLFNVIHRQIRNDTKIIFLPQAFGSFKDNILRKSFKKIIDRSNLIFVRDTKSLDYLRNTFGENSKFILSPDFTNILDAGKIQDYEEGDISIIPNHKMIHDGIYEGDKYINLFKLIINHLLEKNEKPYFLIHEGEKDLELANFINKNLLRKIPISKPDDPIVIKNRIKSSKLVITSRFHGLVSALSQGIPVVSTSWTHKYKELMKEYNNEDNIIDVFEYKTEIVFSKIDSLLDVNLNKYWIYQKKYIDNEKNKVNLMWDIVSKELQFNFNNCGNN